MKKIFAVFMMLALACAGHAAAENMDISVIWENEPVDAACVAIDGRIYVDIEQLAAALGLEYEFSAEAGQATVKFSGNDPEIVGKWLLGDDAGTYMEFHADGSGVSGGAAADIATIIFEWTRSGDSVVLEYTFMGVATSAEYSYSADAGTLTYAGNAGRVFSRGQENTVLGEWQCQLADALSTLTINDDGTAKLVIANAVYNITWTLEGSALYLDQNGAVLTAEFDGETINLPIAGMNMVFTR